MKKKILSLCLVVAMVATAVVGASMAYLQDEDSDVNVMTLGNVSIEQHEYQRATNDDGTYKTDTIDNQTSYVLEAFEQGKALLPIVGDPSLSGGDAGYAGWDSTDVRMTQVKSYGGMQVFAGKNAVDKFVTVENTGKTDAYVRTLVAIEVGTAAPSLIGYSNHFTWEDNKIGVITIDGNNYYLHEFVYAGWQDGDRHVNGILPAGDTSYPNLSQVYIKSAATNEDMEKLDGNGNGTLDILVLSQAVQAAGFSDAQTALDTAFGKASENAAEWFANVEAPVLVKTRDELQAAINDAVDGDVITLAADIAGDVTVTQKADVKITIDGNGKTLAGVILVDGQSSTITTAGLTIKNVTFKAESISADACINLGDGTTATRYTHNVTVENCTFDVKDAVGVKSYTGGDKNLTITGCTVTTDAHSLVQAKGIDGILVENCTVNSKNGLNFNNSNNVTVDNCTVNTRGYCVRFGESSGGTGTAETYLIKNSSLTTTNVEKDDAAIILRGTADNATLTIENTTITVPDGCAEITNTATGATVVK